MRPHIGAFIMKFEKRNGAVHEGIVIDPVASLYEMVVLLPILYLIVSPNIFVSFPLI